MPFDHNDHYHRLLLRHVPQGARAALDVGCGTGRFARRLVARGLRVDALDPDPATLAAAEAAGGGPHYRRADAARDPLPSARYDVITCLASLHHMPFSTPARFRDALAPGGRLLVLGCYAGHTPWDLAAVPVNAVARAAVHGTERARGIRTPPRKAPVRQPGMTPAQLRAESARLLPGRELRQLLFWRYLLTYTK